MVRGAPPSSLVTSLSPGVSISLTWIRAYVLRGCVRQMREETVYMKALIAEWTAYWHI